MECFDVRKGFKASVILTGTAGDGKTFLCGRVWEHLGGDPEIWAGQETHCRHDVQLPPDAEGRARKVRVHVLRDLSAWVPMQGVQWPPDKRDLMLRFCRSLYIEHPDEVFLIAANDGQLAETFRRLLPASEAQRAKELIEELLVTDRETEIFCPAAPGEDPQFKERARLRLYTLRLPSIVQPSQLFGPVLLRYGAYSNQPGFLCRHSR
jgi:hypothetical protein